MFISLFHLNKALVCFENQEGEMQVNQKVQLLLFYISPPVSSACKVKSALKSNIVLSSDICKRL